MTDRSSRLVRRCIFGALLAALVVGFARDPIGRWWSPPDADPPVAQDELPGAVLTLPQVDDPLGDHIRLTLAPGLVGVNAVTVQALRGGDGGSAPGVDAVRLNVTSLQRREPAVATDVKLPGDGSAGAGQVTFAHPGWWEVWAVMTGPGGGRTASVFLLVPDPNLNGIWAPADQEEAAGAEALMRRGLHWLAVVPHLRYEQTTNDGDGNFRVVTGGFDDGSGGRPPVSFAKTPDGEQITVVGERTWTLSPGAPPVALATPAALPSVGDDRYDGTRGFAFSREDTLAGEACQIVLFQVPGRGGPRPRAAAWYAWWIGEQSGRVLQEAVVSVNRYEVTRFTAFGPPLPAASPPPTVAPGATPGP